MGFLKTLWTKFSGLKTWQKVLVIVLLGSMVAGGFSGSGQSGVSSDKPTPVVTEEALPETTLDVISKSNVGKLRTSCETKNCRLDRRWRLSKPSG